MRDRWVLAAVALVCATNLVALAKGAWNRATVTSSLTLTERELRASYPGNNSVTQVRITWTQHWPVRIDADQAGRIGFDSSEDPASAEADEYYRRQLPRLGFVALEYDGSLWETYREKILRAPSALLPEPPPAEAQKHVKQQELTIEQASRLFAIAVDGDPQRLRAAYPELSRYLLAKARIALRVDHVEAAGKRKPVLSAHVIELTPSVINVPRPFPEFMRVPTEPAAYRYTGASPGGPPYVVDLKYGAAYEPWISDIRARSR